MLRLQILLSGGNKTFLNKIKNILASLTQILLPKQTFPNLATEETFQLVPSAAPER